MPKIINEDKVYQAAIEVLVAHGYESATTKIIAAAAEIHEATLFRKFGNKLNLIEQAIEYQLSTTPLNKLVYTGDLVADLEAIVAAYLETNQLHGELIPILLAEAPRHPDLKKATLRLWLNIQTITEIIERYQGEGKLKKEPVLMSVNNLIGPLMTSQMIKRANLGIPTPEIDAAIHVANFLQGRNR